LVYTDGKIRTHLPTARDCYEDIAVLFIKLLQVI
jgi:hypothetical protein